VQVYPDTRLSLITRLKNRTDQDAWDEFVEIYRPVVCRLARLKGLQDADVEDLAQQVLTAVAAAVDRWDPDKERGRFRAWLTTIARNLILNMITRRPPDCGLGEEIQNDHLDLQVAREGPNSDLIRIESRREVFHWAARQITGEFQPETWQSFMLTAVEGLEPTEVAKLLGKSLGAVYAARGRVMRRLREKVLEWDWADVAE
jgi:RNA polymerase sigma factor (sigma-70 family)